MDQILAIRIFTRVAEMSSFTKAAQSLGLPKASVSAWIQSLEAQLGTRLLHRTTRRVQLTHDGQVYYERGKDFLADAEEMAGLFQSDTRPLSGRIRVDMPSRMARLKVIPRLPEFIALHPEIMIELGSTDREVNLVEEGYDCVVRVGELDDSGLMSKRIGALEVIQCVSPDYLKRHGRPRSITDLSKHLLIHYAHDLGDKGGGGFEYWDGERYREIAMKGLITVNNAEAYVAACLAGLGIIQSPKHTLERYLKRGELIEVLPKVRSEPMPVSIVYPSKRNLSRRVRVFMEWLETVVAK